MDDCKAYKATEENVEKALGFLIQTDKEAAQAKARMESLKDQKKTVEALEFLKAKGNSVAERESIARSSRAYMDNIEETENATADYEILRNRRKTAELIIEVWRTIQANQRKGNV